MTSHSISVGIDLNSGSRMKIRNGFVANSSSSSFILVGRQVPVPESTPLEHNLVVLVKCEGTVRPLSWDNYMHYTSGRKLDGEESDKIIDCVDISCGAFQDEIAEGCDFTKIKLPEKQDDGPYVVYFGTYAC